MSDEYFNSPRGRDTTCRGGKRSIIHVFFLRLKIYLYLFSDLYIIIYIKIPIKSVKRDENKKQSRYKKMIMPAYQSNCVSSVSSTLMGIPLVAATDKSTLDAHFSATAFYRTTNF